MDVVHLVAKTGEQAEASNNSEESSMNNESNTSRRRESSLFSLMNRLIRTEGDGSESGGLGNKFI